jgi:FKBP-type peptidyl-prolyl cis-trans isomerase
MRMRSVVLISLLLVACQKGNENQSAKQSNAKATSPHDPGSAGVGPTKAKPEQIQPPLDLKNPPADATKTASGLIYKKLVANDSGQVIHRNDRVMINYTGWRQSSGDTFFSNRARGQPMPLNLASTAPGFTEAMQLLKKGEKAMLWVPPSIGYKGPPQGTPETLVYEVEVVEVVPAPAIPEDLTAPPATAQALKSGTKLVVLRPGTGKDKPRSFDTVTFNYSAWESSGKMFDSSEMSKRTVSAPPFRQSAVMEEVLTAMTAGERVRFWAEAERLSAGGKMLPGMPKGLLCYEVEILQIAKAEHVPPPAPPDVAKPPAGAQKSPKGVSYRVLKAGKGGAKPKPTDTVKVNYTGWTTDGRMFDSSELKGTPAEFGLNGVVAGWTDAIPLMSPGDKWRMWIPEELAYKGAPGRPQGMLVFDVELVEIKAPATPKADDPHAAPPGTKLPAPPDVKEPPKDAKKSPKGVFYKILSGGNKGQHPSEKDTVKVNYTGWTTDGQMFDSSVTKGQPAQFSLQRVIPGWTDVFPQLGVGDKARIWIPEELAYKGQPGRPQGMLVFDVELLEIVNAQ